MTDDQQELDYGPLVQAASGQRYLYGVNRDTFRTQEPDSVFEHYFGERIVAPDTLFVFVGTDSGLLPRYLKKRRLPDGTRYIFVEHPAVHAAIEKAGGNIPADETMAICTPENFAEQARGFGIDNYLYTEKFKVLKSIGAIDAHVPEYALLWQQVDDKVSEFAWRTTTVLGHKTFRNADLLNVADNVLPASVLNGRFNGQTAVILAGGPSLDDILPWVARHRNEITVLAVSRVARALTEAGISPDFIFAIDPNDSLLAVSFDCYRFADTAVLVHSSYVYPPFIQQWPGRHVYLGQAIPWPFTGRQENLPVTPPTVTNSALTCAMGMGFSTVILGGVDLCYSPEGHTHASGSVEREAGPSLQEIGFRVVTNDGAIAETNSAYHFGIQSLASQAEFAATHGCRLINPAPRAARVPGVAFVTLDAIALPVGGPARREAVAPEPSPEQRIKHFVTTLGEILRMESEVSAIQDLAEKALETNKSIFDTRGKIDHRSKAALDGIEATIESRHGAAARFLKAYGIALFAKSIRPKDKQWTAAETRKWTQNYYRAYRESCAELIGQLRRARTLIELRIEELVPEPDFIRLGSNWLANRTPGRMDVLARRRPEVVERATRRYEPLVRRLRQAVTDQEKSRQVLVSVKRRKALDLQQLRAKARLLSNAGDRDRLERLARYAEEQPELRDLYALTSGYLAEQDQDVAGAINAYQQVQPGPFIEDALAQMAGLLLSTGDVPNARAALECLTYITPAYMPQYAELLRLSGDLKAALDEYARYFELVPSDFLTMLKVAAIYRELGKPETAELIYRHVLESDPNNAAAASALADLSGGARA